MNLMCIYPHTARRNSIFHSFIDGLGMGMGFTFALSLMGAIREVLGANTLWGYTVFPGFEPVTIMILPAGGFFTIGAILALMTWWDNRKRHKEARS